MPHILSANGFFKDMITQDKRINLLCAYDSKTIANGAVAQGSMGVSIINTWDFPNQSDGTPALVGLSTHGPRTTSGLDKLLGHANATASNFTGTSYTATTAEPRYNADAYELPPTHCTVYNRAAGTGRTAWAGALTNLNGVLFAVAFGGAPVQAGSTGSATTCNAGAMGVDPFAGRSTRTKFIGIRPGSNGPNDMRCQGFRQLDNQGTISAANTVQIGSPTTADFSGTADVFGVSCDCGNGWGRPGLLLANPASVVDTLQWTCISAGAAVFRDDGAGNRLNAGVTVGMCAIGGLNTAQWASGMGATGMGTTPDPYNTTAKAQKYLKEWIDMPTHVVWYTGHNFQAAERTDIIAGLSGAMTHVWRDHTIAAFDAITAMCLAEGKPAPKFLIVLREWNKHDHTTGTDMARFDQMLQQEAAAVCIATGAEMVDLFHETWDGTTTDYDTLSWDQRNAAMPYTQRAHNQAVAGGASGPVQASSTDWLHNSVQGQMYLARMVWDIGMDAIGYVRGANFGHPRKRSDVERYRNRAG